MPFRPPPGIEFPGDLLHSSGMVPPRRPSIFRLFLAQKSRKSWRSHRDLQPPLVALLRELLGPSLRVTRFDMTTPIRTQRFAALARETEAWICPHGAVNDGLLKLFAAARKSLKTAGPRWIIMLNAEGARGGANLLKIADSLRQDDTLVVASHVEQKLVAGYFKPGQAPRILKIALPVDVPKIRRCPPNSPTLLYAGRLSPQKNVHLLIDALALARKKIPALRLEIAGSPDQIGFPHFGLTLLTPYRHMLQKRIHQHHLHSHVRFLGQLSQKQLFAKMSRISAQISLSTHFGEDFGYSIAQGLTLGLPTVVSAWGGHREWQTRAQVRSVPVILAHGIPTVDIRAAARQMVRVIQQNQRPSQAGAFEWQIRTQWQRALSAPRRTPSGKIALTREVVAHWAKVEKQGRPAFHPKDALYQRIVRCYRGGSK